MRFWTFFFCYVLGWVGHFSWFDFSRLLHCLWFYSCIYVLFCRIKMSLICFHPKFVSTNLKSFFNIKAAAEQEHDTFVSIIPQRGNIWSRRVGSKNFLIAHVHILISQRFQWQNTWCWQQQDYLVLQEEPQDDLRSKIHGKGLSISFCDFLPFSNSSTAFRSVDEAWTRRTATWASRCSFILEL